MVRLPQPHFYKTGSQGRTRSVPRSWLLSVLVGGRADAVQRAHVATYGLNSNTSFNCSVANPCRFFQAATSVVDPNGEVVVLDSGGYGAVTLTQSISLIAPPGVYAGISVLPRSIAHALTGQMTKTFYRLTAASFTPNQTNKPPTALESPLDSRLRWAKPCARRAPRKISADK